MDVSALQDEFQMSMEYRRRCQARAEERPWDDDDLERLRAARQAEDEAWLALYRAQRGEACS